jgi:hypothetical protein
MMRKPTEREKFRALAKWCQKNNFSLNVNKTKELIMDFSRQQSEQSPIHIESVKRFKFLSMHITEMVHSHKQCGKEGATAPLQPQEAEGF